MAHQVREGFKKANSQSLPFVDMQMLMEYLMDDDRYASPEMRGVRAVRSGRESYGDSAIGYVQLERTLDNTTVVAGVTPEHNVRSKSCQVKVNIDVKHSKITLVTCYGCVAANGECKHGLGFLFWLHRRSESPSVTEVETYWKKSILLEVGEILKFIDASSFNKRKYLVDFRRRITRGCFIGSENDSLIQFFSASFFRGMIAWIFTCLQLDSQEIDHRTM